MAHDMLLLLMPPAATHRYYILSFSARHSRKASSYSTHSPPFAAFAAPSSAIMHAISRYVHLPLRLQVPGGFCVAYLCALLLLLLYTFFPAFMCVQVLNSCFLLVLVIVGGIVVVLMCSYCCCANNGWFLQPILQQKHLRSFPLSAPLG